MLRNGYPVYSYLRLVIVGGGVYGGQGSIMNIFLFITKAFPCQSILHSAPYSHTLWALTLSNLSKRLHR
jgi:hypothetical protein